MKNGFVFCTDWYFGVFSLQSDTGCQDPSVYYSKGSGVKKLLYQAPGSYLLNSFYSMRNSNFQLLKSDDHRFFFKLQTYAGESIFTSQTHPSKSATLATISEVLNFGREDKYFSRRLSADYKYYFVVKNRHGKILGISQMFDEKCDRENSSIDLRVAILKVNLTDMS